MSSKPPPIPQIPPRIPVQPHPAPREKKRFGIVAWIVVGLGVVGAGLILFQLILFGLVASKSPRSRTPGEAEFREANRQIIRHQGSVGFGNNSQAVALAGDYSKGLKILRESLFTEGKKGAYSISKGEFLTYCQLNGDSCVFLVHVPELRRFTGEAKKSMSELVWMNAQAVLKDGGVTPPKTVAVGVKGAVLYDAVMIGSLVTDPEQSSGGITERGSGVTGAALLYRFFAPGAAVAGDEAGPPIDRVRSEVAAILGKPLDQVDLKKPLAEQGADELDIVEIVMALEEAFKVEIPDSALSGSPGEASKSLSVEQLAEIVSKQRKPE